MKRFIYGLLVWTCMLLAATPKPFAEVGDPVYRDVNAVKKLSGLYVFQAQKRMLEAYVRDAEQLRETGFALEKRKDKQSAGRYLQGLRRLAEENRKIGKLVTQALEDAIAGDMDARFRQIASSGHSVLTENTALQNAYRAYDKKLRERERTEQAKRRDYYRSPAHLEGTWKDGKKARWIFRGRQLSIVTVVHSKTRTLEGTWALKGEQLTFDIDAITNQTAGQTAHRRSTKVQRRYRLLDVDAKRLRVESEEDRRYTLEKQ